jgi:hypothetical protein
VRGERLHDTVARLPVTASAISPAAGSTHVDHTEQLLEQQLHERGIPLTAAEFLRTVLEALDDVASDGTFVP